MVIPLSLTLCWRDSASLTCHLGAGPVSVFMAKSPGVVPNLGHLSGLGICTVCTTRPPCDGRRALQFWSCARDLRTQFQLSSREGGICWVKREPAAGEDGCERQSESWPENLSEEGAMTEWI